MGKLEDSSLEKVSGGSMVFSDTEKGFIVLIKCDICGHLHRIKESIKGPKCEECGAELYAYGRPECK